MKFELIGEDSNCPYKLSIEDGAVSESHFHETLTLLQILAGEMTCILSGAEYTLFSRDIMFINPYEIHSVSRVGDDCRLIVLNIDINQLKKYFYPEESPVFKWDETINSRESGLYLNLSDKIRGLIITAINREPSYLAAALQDVLSILTTLYNKCLRTISRPGNPSHTAQQALKSAEIIRYLNEHYTEPVSLNDVSLALHLSAPYISKIFKDSFGIGFLEYLNRLRVKKSLDILTGTDEYILDVALSVGFNNSKTYSRAFRQYMGVTPGEYRKTHRPHTLSPGLEESSASYPEKDLLHFLYDTDAQFDFSDVPEYDTVSLNQDFVHGAYKNCPKKWNKILSVGVATLLLQHHIQQEILDAARDMDFEYVRFVGVLSDTLQIYQENPDGSPKYFWILLDEILDFLVKNRLKPFICLGYMPEKLALRSVPSPYWWIANTSKPKSQQKWDDYLSAFLRHCIDRYSREEVNTWMFEFWNSPELNGIFWHDSEEDFEQFFLSSYRVFRLLLPDGKFGSPGQIGFDHFVYSRRFFSFCMRQKVRFDFICMHSYGLTDPNNLDFWLPRNLMDLQNTEAVKKDYLIRSVRDMSRVLSELHINAPLYITEWNVSPYFHDLSRDTCFMGAYIADTVAHLPDAVKSITYLALNDYTEEHVPNQDLFTGELGLKTHNSLPKPSYLAFLLLNRMGGKLYSSGDGYMMTSTENGYQILLYNYCFYNENFLNGSSHRLTMFDRYRIFENGNTKQYHLYLTIPDGHYRIEHYSLNREAGSVYDEWVRMGAPEVIDDSTYRYLLGKGYPDMDIRHQKIEGHLLLTENVVQHGILLITLNRVNG